MDEFNYLLVLVLFMLFVTVFMDMISLFMVKKGSVDIEDYATAVLKWPKVILLVIFGIIMLYYAFTTQATALTLVAELVSGVLVIADGIIGIIIKAKYGKKK
ncbi:MAG: hypothetical protein IJZ61_03645 [Oscillospiraceae bacterium]|nr:hypothetical protein [Oscillospiraceae bacterium]